MMTEIKKETIRLLWLGHNSLQIVAELVNKYDIGESQQALMPKAIAEIRAEIEDFRKRAPELAEECFRRGEEWRDVLAKFAEVGLIPSIEYVGICSRASAKVEAEQTTQNSCEASVNDFEVLNRRLQQQAIDAAARIDPSIRARLDADIAEIEKHQQRLDAAATQKQEPKKTEWHELWDKTKPQ